MFRPDKLRRDLKKTEAEAILKSCGYESAEMNNCLTELISRIRGNDKFPHEIGLFLGYPAVDVKGFIENKAANYEISGLWKVYGDRDEAERTFARYRKCTDIYCREWMDGKSMEMLAVAE